MADTGTVQHARKRGNISRCRFHIVEHMRHHTFKHVLEAFEIEKDVVARAAEYLEAKVESANNGKKKEGNAGNEVDEGSSTPFLSPILWEYCHHAMSSSWEKLDSVRLSMILYTIRD
jgi:hypothetical protein